MPIGPGATLLATYTDSDLGFFRRHKCNIVVLEATDENEVRGALHQDREDVCLQNLRRLLHHDHFGSQRFDGTAREFQ